MDTFFFLPLFFPVGIIKLYMSPRVEMAIVIIALSTIDNAEHVLQISE